MQLTNDKDVIVRLEGAVAGQYNWFLDKIALEAPERTSGRELMSVFEHEFTHRSLTQLTELGFVLQLLTRQKLKNAIHPAVQLIASSMEPYQECFATNVEVYSTYRRGADWQRIINRYPAEYRKAYLELADLQPIFQSWNGNGAILISLLGIYTLGAPVFELLRGLDIIIDRQWSGTLDTHQVLPSYRFELAKDALRKTFEPNMTIAEIIRKSSDVFGLPWCIVNRQNVLDYAEALPVECEYRSEVRDWATGYHYETDIGFDELYQRAWSSSIRSSCIHFGVRIRLPLNEPNLECI